MSPERLARTLSRLRRRLSLLATFVVVSAGILAGGALALGAALTDALRAHTVGEARRTASDYVDRLVRPWLPRDGAGSVNPHPPAPVPPQPAPRPPPLLSVKGWTPDGTP